MGEKKEDDDPSPWMNRIVREDEVVEVKGLRV